MKETYLYSQHWRVQLAERVVCLADPPGGVKIILLQQTFEGTETIHQIEGRDPFCR